MDIFDMTPIAFLMYRLPRQPSFEFLRRDSVEFLPGAQQVGYPFSVPHRYDTRNQTEIAFKFNTNCVLHVISFYEGSDPHCPTHIARLIVYRRVIDEQIPYLPFDVQRFGFKGIDPALQQRLGLAQIADAAETLALLADDLAARARQCFELALL